MKHLFLLCLCFTKRTLHRRIFFTPVVLLCALSLKISISTAAINRLAKDTAIFGSLEYLEAILFIELEICVLQLQHRNGLEFGKKACCGNAARKHCRR